MTSCRDLIDSAPCDVDAGSLKPSRTPSYLSPPCVRETPEAFGSGSFPIGPGPRAAAPHPTDARGGDDPPRRRLHLLPAPAPPATGHTPPLPPSVVLDTPGGGGGLRRTRSPGRTQAPLTQRTERCAKKEGGGSGSHREEPQGRSGTLKRATDIFIAVYNIHRDGRCGLAPPSGREWGVPGGHFSDRVSGVPTVWPLSFVQPHVVLTSAPPQPPSPRCSARVARPSLADCRYFAPPKPLPVIISMVQFPPRGNEVAVWVEGRLAHPSPPTAAGPSPGTGPTRTTSTPSDSSARTRTPTSPTGGGTTPRGGPGVGGTPTEADPSRGANRTRRPSRSFIEPPSHSGRWQGCCGRSGGGEGGGGFDVFQTASRQTYPKKIIKKYFFSTLLCSI